MRLHLKKRFPRQYKADRRSLIDSAQRFDSALMQFKTIWASAGHPKAVFALTPDQLVELTKGGLCDKLGSCLFIVVLAEVFLREKHIPYHDRSGTGFLGEKIGF